MEHKALSSGSLQPPASPEQGTGRREYSLRDLLTVLFKRRGVILTFFVATVVTVFIGLLVKQPWYEVTAAILVKKTRAEVPLSPTPSSEPIIVFVSEEDLNSEIEILRDRALVEGVIEDLGLSSGEPPGPVARTVATIKAALGSNQLSDLDETVLAIEENLSFRAIARSNVVELSYRAKDPGQAEEFMTAFIDRYMERRTSVHQPAQLVSIFDDQTLAAEQRLADAEGALQRFMRDSAVSGPVDSETGLARQTLDEFERRLAQARVDLQASASRVAALEVSLESVPERLPTSYRQNQAPETEEITRAITQLRLDRDDLLTRGYGASNVRVRDIEAQIDLAQRSLGEAEQRIGSINRTELNAVHQDLKSRLLAAQAELEATRALHDELTGQVVAFRADVADLTRKSFGLQRLRRDATVAEESYLLYRRKQEEVQVSLTLDQQNMVSVSVARAPRRPLRPTGPPKKVVLLSALILAAIGGLGAGFGREFVDGTISTPEDLERRLGITHLASIPRWHGPELPPSTGGHA